MTRTHAVAALVCAVVLVALVSLYPLHIDGNQSCGGITGRVALVGSYNSGEGEPTAQDTAAAKAVAARCQTRARAVLVGAALGGALVGLSGAALLSRRRRQRVDSDPEPLAPHR